MAVQQSDRALFNLVFNRPPESAQEQAFLADRASVKQGPALRGALEFAQQQGQFPQGRVAGATSQSVGASGGPQPQVAGATSGESSIDSTVEAMKRAAQKIQDGQNNLRKSELKNVVRDELAKNKGVLDLIAQRDKLRTEFGGADTGSEDALAPSAFVDPNLQASIAGRQRGDLSDLIGSLTREIEGRRTGIGNVITDITADRQQDIAAAQADFNTQQSLLSSLLQVANFRKPSGGTGVSGAGAVADGGEDTLTFDDLVGGSLDDIGGEGVVQPQATDPLSNIVIGGETLTPQQLGVGSPALEILSGGGILPQQQPTPTPQAEPQARVKGTTTRRLPGEALTLEGVDLPPDRRSVSEIARETRQVISIKVPANRQVIAENAMLEILRRAKTDPTAIDEAERYLQYINTGIRPTEQQNREKQLEQFEGQLDGLERATLAWNDKDTREAMVTKTIDAAFATEKGDILGPTAADTKLSQGSLIANLFSILPGKQEPRRDILERVPDFLLSTGEKLARALGTEIDTFIPGLTGNIQAEGPIASQRDTKLAALQEQAILAYNIVRISGETGRLSDQDLELGLRLIPRATDSKEVALGRLKRLREKIALARRTAANTHQNKLTLPEIGATDYGELENTLEAANARQLDQFIESRQGE